MGPLSTYRQNETPTWTDTAWTDEQGIQRSSPTYALSYVFAGPSAAPVPLVGTALAGGWTTTLDATNSAKLTPGDYVWQAILTGTGYRRVICEGRTTIEVDLASVAAPYDGRTDFEKALADAYAALATFQQSGGRIQSYTIGNRQMSFQRDTDLLAVIKELKAQVNTERSNKKGGRDRFITQTTPRG